MALAIIDREMQGRRACAVVLGGLVLAWGALCLYHSGPSGLAWLPGCPFHGITGLHCPGCGMTRAAYETLHGRLGAAFRLNPVGMILLPLAGVGLGVELLGWLRGQTLRWQLGGRGAWAIFWLLVGFWILRNIPCWPLTMLAPR